MKWTEISYHLISRFKFSPYVSFTFPVEMKYRYHRVVLFKSLWHYELFACTSCMKKLFFKTNSGVPRCWVMKHKRLVLSPEFIWRWARRAVGFRCSKFPHFLNMSVSVCPTIPVFRAFSRFGLKILSPNQYVIGIGKISILTFVLIFSNEYL